jgi:hypothetical protein
VAAELAKDPGLEVELAAGRLGELSVEVDGRRVYSALPLPLLWPRERRILEKVRAALGGG